MIYDSLIVGTGPAGLAVANSFHKQGLSYLAVEQGPIAAPGIPLHDPATLETPTPGLFVAGVITGGNISGKVFIENSRHHGDLIAPRVRAILAGGQHAQS